MSKRKNKFCKNTLRQYHEEPVAVNVVQMAPGGQPEAVEDGRHGAYNGQEEVVVDERLTKHFPDQLDVGHGHLVEKPGHPEHPELGILLSAGRNPPSLSSAASGTPWTPSGAAAEPRRSSQPY